MFQFLLTVNVALRMVDVQIINVVVSMVTVVLPMIIVVVVVNPNLVNASKTKIKKKHRVKKKSYKIIKIKI